MPGHVGVPGPGRAEGRSLRGARRPHPAMHFHPRMGPPLSKILYLQPQSGISKAPNSP